jgi:hypothetical protein
VAGPGEAWVATPAATALPPLAVIAKTPAATKEAVRNFFIAMYLSFLQEVETF